MPSKPTSTAEYLAALPEEKRAVVERMRKSIGSAVPRAEECFSYGIPASSLDGKPLAWVAAWKSHYSFYPVSKTTLETHATEVGDYKTLKGTIQFPASQPVPYALVKKLAKARAAELKQHGR